MLGRSNNSVCCAERNLDTEMGKGWYQETPLTCMALLVIT